MHQYDRRAEDPYYKRVRRIHCLEDPGSGGKRHLTEIKVGRLYFQICEDIYACGMLCGAGAGIPAPAGENAGDGPQSGMGKLGLQSPDFPGHQLSLRTSDQHPFKFLCGDRRSQQRGRAGKGFQLPGNTFQNGYGSL